ETSVPARPTATVAPVQDARRKATPPPSPKAAAAAPAARTVTPPPAPRESTATSPAPRPTVATPPPPSARPTWIVVQPGETLASLAQRWGTSVAAIMMANNLVSDKVSPGKQLRLPDAGKPASR
ncbi:MAG TPA: LysM peptidoglycan-binding domain-containing protein, partial [Verrucomicrobiae bacterium]|nr:LysM peptidoglycan-binding domain-containing protein [Verrucomicrobiae bacterium]